VDRSIDEDTADRPPLEASAPTDSSSHAGSPPTYVRLRELLRAGIERGEYDRRRLPTDQELVQRFGVSRHTVRQAMSGLTAEGLIRREPGRGTYATGAHHSKYVRALGNVSDLMAMGDDTTLKVLTNLHENRDEQIAQRLALTDDLVMTMFIVRFRHGHPLGCADVHLPPHIGNRIQPLSTVIDYHVSIIGLVEQTTDGDIAGAEQDLTAVRATPAIAHVLQVAEGDPLLRTERLYYAQNGSPVEFAISHYRPDRYTYRFSLRGKTGW
jgi:GntR family transcriptional regulator